MNSPHATAVAAPVAGQAPRLRARGLMKAYPGLTVLNGADLDVAAGEVVAVRGASGTGKSTLLHLLGLLERPDAGNPVNLARARAAYLEASDLFAEFGELEKARLVREAAADLDVTVQESTI